MNLFSWLVVIKNIQIGFDNMNWIKMKREKTQRQISIPILPKAQEISAKYLIESSFVIPVLSYQKFNAYLKRDCYPYRNR